MNQPGHFNFALKFGPYKMRIIEQPLMPGNATLTFNEGQQAWFIRAGIPREKQYELVWTIVMHIAVGDFHTFMQDGRIPPEASPGEMLAPVMIDALTNNQYLRSFKNFERTVNDAPVQIDVPTPKIITN